MTDAAEAEVSGRAERLARWTSGYRPHPGVPDAFLDASGRPRAAWTRVLDRLGDLTEVDIAARFVSAVRHIRDTGISYRIYGDKREHAWPLGSLPFVVEADDWQALSAGIVERADMMEAILADIYGPNRLVADGLLPSAVVAGSPEFMRPLAGIVPPGGRFLKLYAADVTRGPDGRWQVLADRTQSPSGPGYALENRMVLTRAFPDLYTDLHVERLAPFFQTLRQGLAEGAQRSDPRICLLTSGPFSSTYVEQAVLARYLGLLLVEGDDLVMQDGALHVRTVSGLKRADALWRRIDSDYVDPLELNPASRLGVPGLVEALRNGSLVVGNMPGSGILESGALAAYLPGIARRLIGNDLRLSGPRTWWCGDPDSLAHVRDNLDALVLRPVATPPKGMARDAIMGPLTLGADRDRLVAALRDRPFDYVAQEPMPLATTPGWDRTGGALHLVPRPFALRVFAAMTPEGWRVMPGGFCRISERPDLDPGEMRAGIKAADVWIMSHGPVEAVPLIQPTAQKVRRIAGHLPSRAADNLFWFGRYVERAEAVIRLVGAHLGGAGAAVNAFLVSDARSPTSLRIRALLDDWGAISSPNPPTALLAREALSGQATYGSALRHSLSARANAAILRERLSGEAWRVLADLTDLLDIGDGRAYSEAELAGVVERGLSLIAALAGLAQENMIRTAGWHFVDLGRRIERVINTCTFATHFAGDTATGEDLGVMLSLCDSHIAFGARYMQGAALDPVRDMVLLDPFNPRSVAFQIEAIERHLTQLPTLRADGLPEPHQRLAAKLGSEFSTGEASEFDGATLERLGHDFTRLADAIATRYFPNAPNALRPEKLVGLG